MDTFTSGNAYKDAKPIDLQKMAELADEIHATEIEWLKAAAEGKAIISSPYMADGTWSIVCAEDLYQKLRGEAVEVQTKSSDFKDGL